MSNPDPLTAFIEEARVITNDNTSYAEELCSPAVDCLARALDIIEAALHSTAVLVATRRDSWCDGWQEGHDYLRSAMREAMCKVLGDASPKPGYIAAPWSRARVDWLNEGQRSGEIHPYTCGNCRADLVATVRGWICPYCDYTQDWAVAMPEGKHDEQH